MSGRTMLCHLLRTSYTGLDEAWRIRIWVLVVMTMMTIRMMMMRMLMRSDHIMVMTSLIDTLEVLNTINFWIFSLLLLLSIDHLKQSTHLGFWSQHYLTNQEMHQLFSYIWIFCCCENGESFQLFSWNAYSVRRNWFFLFWDFELLSLIPWW